MKYLVLLVALVLFGCFFVPASYTVTETVECWDCNENPVYPATAKTVQPVPLLSPFVVPVAPAKIAPPAMPELEKLALRPSPYSELSLDDVEIIKTYHVEFRMGEMTVRGPGEPPSAPSAPPPTKARRTKRPAGKRPVKSATKCPEYMPNYSLCPPGCLPEEICF
jgi:hypothetical protein